MTAMDRHAMAVLSAFVLAIGTCGAEAQDRRAVRGEVFTRERIALDPAALVVVEVTGPDGRTLAATQAATEGRQVPLAFALDVPAGEAQELRAAVFLDGQVLFASAAVPISEPDADETLEPVRIDRFHAVGFGMRWNCGATPLQIEFVGDGARLRIGTVVVALSSVPTASGARYESADDPGLWVWNKGDEILAGIDGVELAECRRAIGPALFPLTARGTEPFWSIEMSEGTATVTRDGASRTFPLGSPEFGPGQIRFASPDGPEIALEDTICRNAMTGMPHPLSARLVQDGGDLTGCAGDPVRLLAGSEWHVRQIEGMDVPEQAHLTIAFDRLGRVAGHSGCNRFAGSYMLTGEGLTLPPLAVTRMACAPELMDLETKFLGTLERVDRFDIGAEGGLVLLGADRKLVTAIRRHFAP